MSAAKFVFAFDVENPPGVSGKPSCLEACRRILPVLMKHNVPATMFIVAELLNDSVQRVDYQRLFQWEGIAMGSHSLKHWPVRVHPLRTDRYTDCLDWREQHIIESKGIIEDVFGKPCPGFRSPWGFPDGLAVEHILRAMRRAGYRWSSSRLWGQRCTLPAPIIRPYTYADLGFPEILEFPSGGWHENVIKGYSFCECDVRAMLAWPSPFPPEAIPLDFITSPAQEVAINRVFIDLALAKDLPYVTVMHPWSLMKFDPEMQMLEGTIAYAKQRGMEFSTFEREYPLWLPDCRS
jgi:peptidoglycan/xylan/chitin deacetylase (PgdA/CDA1 family)